MQKLTTIRLARVRYIPKTLEPGVLYVSEEFEAAVHLCACGCGLKVSTPLGPAEWSFLNSPNGPSLEPSIGNWQLPCRSHYVIADGNVRRGGQWSDIQVAAGRRAEEQRRQAYYASLDRERGFWHWLWKLVRKLSGR